MRSRRIIGALANISTVTALVFLYLFVSRNGPGLTALFAVSALALLYGLFYLAAAGILLQSLATEPRARGSDLLPRLALILVSAALLWVFVNATVLDYYQPLSLYDEAIGMLALWWGMLILKNLLGLFSPGAPVRPLLLLSLAALLGWPAAAALQRINAPVPGEGVAANIPVFVGGADGYAIYRIPGLVLLPAGSILANGTTLKSDRLLAFAEARRDGALDSGVIDLALKISDDGGDSWSEQAIICRHQSGERRGKCGNPTPLYDRESGAVVLAYNLSGLASDPRHHSAHLVSSRDGGLSWSKPRQLADDNFVFGPGKGIRKAGRPHRGRLLLPGHVESQAMVYFSDDHGLNWHRGGGLQGGNETDVAELSDGRLYLATRHVASIGRAPEPNGRLFSISTDGGASWSQSLLDEALPTPVCQVSVLQADDGGLLFSNPAHHQSRARITVRYSGDGGSSWPGELLVYPGPGGYSVLAQASDGDILLLYENGNMAYSERISLARIPRHKLLPSPTPE